MKFLKALIFISTLSFSLKAGITDKEVNKIVDSIYILEGGAKTAYPFGIKSIKYKGVAGGRKEWARRICFNTVKNNHARWEKSDKKKEFFVFLADRYCPKAADPTGNRNWIKNIHKLMAAKNNGVKVEKRVGFSLEIR